MPHGNHLSKTAAGMVAVFLFVYWALPSNPIDLGPTTSSEQQYRGAFHVHSVKSDGGGTVAEIATAARSANLDFVILTDHGDGTEFIAPQYIDDILILNGVEISTNGGHYIAIGMPQAPYPLGGDARGVVEDVRRLGGFGVIAHPYSPRETLRWQDFTLPVDAIEWINGDSQWRDSSVVSLLSAGLYYWLRSVGSLNALLDRPTDAMNMWDAMASNSPVIALAGLDAHARLATGSGDEGYTGDFLLRFPWYEDLFQLFGLRVTLDRALTGDAEADAAHLLSSIHSGRFYSSVESRATPPDFTFLGTLPDGTIIEMGDSSPGNHSLKLVATISGPQGAKLRLFENGTTVAESTSLEVAHNVSASLSSAAYRVEVYLPGRDATANIPWIVSNPIFVDGRQTERQPSMTTSAGYEPPPNAWQTENHADTEVSLELNNEILTLTYTLGNSKATYAAMVYDIDTARIDSNTSLDFVVRASKPMRISAQLRRGASGDYRWRHSFYADDQVRRVRLSVRDFAPVGDANSVEESAAEIDGLLFVADTVNHYRNSSGEFQISELNIQD